MDVELSMVRHSEGFFHVNDLFPLPDSDSDLDTDSCSMQDFSTGSETTTYYFYSVLSCHV